MKFPQSFIREFETYKEQYNRGTISALVTDFLRKAILRGYFCANQNLSTEQISKYFKVSRMPVREAFKKLEVEGLVNVVPQKGVVVANISTKELKDITELRIYLEKMALELSFPHMTKETLDKLQGVIDESEKIKKFNNPTEEDRFMELGDIFHDTIYSFADNNELKNIISQQRKKFGRYLRLNNIVPSTLEIICSDHRNIFNAIKEGDRQEALIALENHIRKTEDRVLKLLKSKE